MPPKKTAAPTTAQAPAAPAPAAAPAAASATPPAAPAFPPAPDGFINVLVDDVLVQVKKGSTVMQACTLAQKEIPHFCFHQRLSVAGNCRMCLVEVEGMPKPVASCHWPAAEGMKVKTSSPGTIEARKGTMEMLLINHPLDCPICDQGGECALQDQAVAYGSDRSRFHENKRAVEDLNIGSKIKTVMTRCIHCTRCVRFATEIAGVEEFGATGRGENTRIGTYVQHALQSELAGNMIDLCPVGALTSKPYAFTARPWELVKTPSIDILDAIGANIRVDSRAGQVMRVVPMENDAVNEEWLSDSARFSYDALTENRLTTPRVKKGQVQYNVGWQEAFKKLLPLFKKATPARIAGLMGNLQSAEDAMAFKMFMQQTLATDHLDCRTDGSSIGAHPALHRLNSTIAGFDTADCILVIGCNPRHQAPLLNIRLRRAAIKRRVPIGLIGEAIDQTYPITHLGDTLEVLEQLASGTHPFVQKLKAAQKPLILLSASLYARPDAQALLAQVTQLAQQVGALTPQWNGVNVLHNTAGQITALDMAVCPATQSGKATPAILNAWKKGALDVLVVYGDGDLQPQQLASGKGALIYIGTHLTPIAQLADVVLPAAAWTEKPGLYANAEGRVQAARQAVKPPLNAKEDWTIFRALSQQISTPLPFDTFEQLRTLVTQFNPAYAPEQLNHTMPQPWPTQALEEAPAKPLPSSAASSALVASVNGNNYYVRNAYLRMSPLMHQCQAQVGTANILPPSIGGQQQIVVAQTVTSGSISNPSRGKSRQKEVM